MITLFCTVILRHHLLICVTIEVWAFQVVLVVKNLPANAGDTRDRHRNAGSGRPLEGGMATHSSILVWRIPWMGEPGGP